MKKYLLFTVLLLSLFSCGGGQKDKQAAVSRQRAYEGIFATEEGLVVEMHLDSTARLVFNDSITYEGRWRARSTDGLEYANIEFAGNINYYYLRDQKLYRSEDQMQRGVNGMDVYYLE